MIRRVEILDVSGKPVAGQAGETTFAIKPGRGLRIYTSTIKAVAGAAQTLADGYGDVLLNIGGNTQRTHTFAQMDALARHAGDRYGVKNDVPGGVAYAPVRFAQFDRENYGIKKAFALDIPPGYGDNDLTILVKSLAAATAPTLNMRAMVQDLSTIPENQWNVVRDADGRPVIKDGRMIPTLVKVIRKPRAVAGNAEEFNDIPLKDVLQGLYLFDPAVAGQPANTRISAVQVTIDGEIKFKRTREENEMELEEMGMNPQAGIFAVIPDITDDPRDSWFLGNKKTCDIHIDYEAAVTAGSLMNVLIERQGAPE
jgi:hypothetical protein